MLYQLIIIKRLKNLLWKKDLDSVYQLKGIMSADDFFIAEQRVKLQKFSNSKNNIESFNKLNIKDPGVFV